MVLWLKTLVQVLSARAVCVAYAAVVVAGLRWLVER